MLFKHNEKFEGTCFKCGKKGHKKSDCWSKSEKTGNYSGAKLEEQEKGFNGHSFTFTLSDSNSEHLGKSIDIVYYSNLLVDAGVTSLIINDKSKFIAFDGNFDLNSHAIELADGSKANVVTGKGVAKVELYDINGSSHDIICRGRRQYKS